MQHLIKKIKNLLSNDFIRNIGWLSGAELINRVFRLGTTVVLARMFNSAEYGLMSIIYTAFEFAQVFTLSQGLGAKIVQGEEENLSAICNSSYWLNWLLCIVIFIIQCLAAFPVAHFYNDNDIIAPLCTSAFVYLMFPLFVVSAALNRRANRLQVIALCNVTQSILANLITIVLALMGMGIWSIVLPMVLTTPVWIVINWKYNSWRPPLTINLEKWQEVVTFGGNLLGVKLLDKLRANLDYLIIGGFFGLDELGIYYFAFNAGFGISRNVISIFTSALFPYLCQVRTDLIQLKKRYFSSLKKAFLVIIPFIALQSGLAPFYVPIIFGEKWTSAIPILILVCLSVIPYSLFIFTSELINTIGKPHLTLYWNIGYTSLFVIALLIAVQGGVFWVAVAVLTTQLLISPPFSLWSNHLVFKSLKNS
ncbi:lipopolysaccharide biosynthesis protein [Crocosphaera sp.]|uniref:lipopolysaccharide biosynthesis protein n=1 Tax=Crocosphaera sp. TaxID=2729996 RepID=UPI003F27AE8E|nr:lipopolysaccharide biosynthesis protein [Crocosphaera sp.]